MTGLVPWVSGVAILLLVAAGLVWWVADDDYVAPTPGRTEDTADAGAAQTALDTLVTALEDGDVDAAAVLGADRAARTRLGAMVRNAAALDLADLSARYVTGTGAEAPDGTWQAAVELTWRLPRYDPGPITTEIDVAFVPADEADDPVRPPGDTPPVLIEAVGSADDTGRTPLWTTGSLEVRRTPHTLVMTRGDDREADAYARMLRAAVPTVRDVVPWESPRLVLEVPATTEELEAVLGAKPGTYDGVAAVSSSVAGGSAPGSAVHVYANPDLFTTLDDAGAQVVLDHEAAHVATRATSTSQQVPLWLLEGFADYVALRDVDLPISTTAGQILAEVRRSGPPETLPDRDDFDSHSADFSTTYESAWLACRLVAELGGEEALLELYDRVKAGEPVADVLPEVVGLDVAEFTERWQRELRELADA